VAHLARDRDARHSWLEVDRRVDAAERLLAAMASSMNSASADGRKGGLMVVPDSRTAERASRSRVEVATTRPPDFSHSARRRAANHR
jgi:hypothetical protein